jgi:release factor glutamine methyltransferase
MEVGDIFKKQHNDLVELTNDGSSIPEALSLELSEKFLKGVPFQYLLEESEFFGHKFYVNSDVLIPRPETEYLVDLIVNQFKGKVTKVLDVGTGSGVILLSLLAAQVGKSGVGVDISAPALEVAKINTKRLGLENKTSFLLSDRLDKVEGSFDLIVSNPPYIRASSHRKLVHPSVDTFEPHEALYLPDDYYTFWFEDFFAEIRSHLKGTFFMEGHELEVETQAKLLERLGFQDIKVLPDLTGVKRFLQARSASQV